MPISSSLHPLLDSIDLLHVLVMRHLRPLSLSLRYL
jgi:hypothetical protein